MQGRDYPSDIDPSARPNQFDDVLGTCGELELMLGRLRREHLLSDDECARCRRQVGRVREQLTNRQEFWEPTPSEKHCPHCHTSAVVDYVDALQNRHHHWKCLGCGRMLFRDAEGRASDEEQTEEWVLESVHNPIIST